MTTAAFPFDLLHAEVVRYAQEAAQRRGSALEKWDQIKEACVEPEEVERHTSLIRQAFAHSNAETQLESMGFRVGLILAEKISKDTGRLSSELEVIKFICKEFWASVFGKQVDNLRTNHQGVYVVQDNKMCVLTSFSEGSQYLKEAGIYLALPCGIVRGALSALGIQSVVTPTVESLPSVKFHIQIQQKS